MYVKEIIKFILDIYYNRGFALAWAAVESVYGSTVPSSLSKEANKILRKSKWRYQKQIPLDSVCVLKKRLARCSETFVQQVRGLIYMSASDILQLRDSSARLQLDEGTEDAVLPTQLLGCFAHNGYLSPIAVTLVILLVVVIDRDVFHHRNILV